MSKAIFDQFVNVVLPTYSDFVLNAMDIQNKPLLRLARQAAFEVFHFHEHILNSKEYKLLKEQNLSFSTLGDAANLLKHVRPDRNSPVVGVEEVIICIRYTDFQGEYTHDDVAVFVFTKNKQACNFNFLLTEVMNLWSDILYQKGILKVTEFNLLERGFIPRNLVVKNNLPLTPNFTGNLSREHKYFYGTYNNVTKRIDRDRREFDPGIVKIEYNANRQEMSLEIRDIIGKSDWEIRILDAQGNEVDGGWNPMTAIK